MHEATTRRARDVEISVICFFYVLLKESVIPWRQV